MAVRTKVVSAIPQRSEVLAPAEHPIAAQVVDMDYYRAKDILYLRLLPDRPARLQEVAEDFFVCFDRDDPQRIVGFEVHYFSLLDGDLDDPTLAPFLVMRFDVVDTPLRNTPLRDILLWAHRQFVTG